VCARNAGKLRPVILHFYAQTSDHIKRLVRVSANGKFSGASAGPDESVNAPEALGAVVANLRVSPVHEDSNVQQCPTAILCTTTRSEPLLKKTLQGPGWPVLRKEFGEPLMLV
jgi:hypothetical protein